MTQEILTALGALRDRVRRNLLDNPEFRALVSIEQSITEIEEAVNARAAAQAALTTTETPAMAPPQPANFGRRLYERAAEQAAAGAEAARHTPYLPTHKVA